MSDNLTIAAEMRAFDNKDRHFYANLTDEERKKFSNYLMIRWGSSVTGGSDLQHFYLVSTNLRLNRHFFDLSKHPELQWLLATTVSPGIGTFRHTWITPPKRATGNNRVERYLASLYPAMKMDDVKTLAQLTDIRELKQQARASGMTDEQIKSTLG